MVDDLKFTLDKGLARISVPVEREHANRAKECCSFHDLAPLQEAKCLPLIVVILDVLDDSDARNVADEGPADCSPDFIALRLHELFVSLVGELVERNLRLILIFLF